MSRRVIKRKVTPPSAPVLAAALTVDENSLDVVLQTPSVGTLPIASYSLERSTNQTTWVSVASGLQIFGSGATYHDTGLVAETAYYYRCRATDTSSRSSGYGYTSGYTSPPPNYAPVWASGWSVTIAAGSSQSIASYASDPNGDSLTFYRNGGNAPTGVTVSLSGSIEVDASTAAGSYTLGLLASDGLLSTSTTCTVTVEAATSTVTFVIPSTTSTWDASVAQTTVSNTSVVPNSVTGAIIELSAGTRTDVATAGTRGPLTIANVLGTASDRITVRNPSVGVVTIRRTSASTGFFVLYLRGCRYLNLDGTNGQTYGIRVMYAQSGSDSPSSFLHIGESAQSVAAVRPTGWITVSGVEVDGGWGNATGIGGTGIQMNDANLPNSSYPALRRQAFHITRCYVHNCWGEGVYIGPNWRESDGSQHLRIRDVEASYNTISYTGRDGIQIKCAIEGTNSMHHNTVTDAGRYRSDTVSGQQYGLSFTDGSFGAIYNNRIENSGEHGIHNYNYLGPPAVDYGTFASSIYNNIVINAGINDSAKSLQGNGIGVEYAAAMSPIIASIYNNTVVSAEKYGILNQNSSGFTRNNLIISSGLGATSGSASTSNNPTSASFVGGTDYHLTAAATASGTVGVDIAATDFDGDTRTAGTADCGAYEYP